MSAIRIVTLLSGSALLFAGGPGLPAAVAQDVQAPAATADAQDRADAAQAPSPAVQDTAATLDTVQVTGSRVLKAGYASPTPVTTIDFEQIELAAPNNIADYLNTMPSLVGDATTTQGNNSISSGTTGMNRLNLRGLGTDRTLVLVDGRRFVGSNLQGNVDANGLPNALIRQVDVVTGGASSVYGSDAVAGVVNFLLDTRYTGTKGYVQFGESAEGDDTQQNIGLTFGRPFAEGRGHLLLNAEYAHSDGIGAARDRDWFRGWGNMINPDWTEGNGQPYRITVPFLNRPNEAFGGLITDGPLRGTTFDPDGSPRPFDYGTLDLTGSNSSGGELDGHFAAMSLKGDVRRKNAFGRASFEISDAFELFAEASAANSVATTHSSYNYFGGSLTIRDDNPYLDPRTRAAMAEAGVDSAPYGLLLGVASPRVEVDTYRAVVGLSGMVGETWDVDAYYQYGESRLSTRVLNVTNSGRLAQAIDAVVDPDSGRIVCRSSLADPGNGCVPLNTFGGAAPDDPALDWVNGSPWIDQTVTQQVASASMSGEAFSTWAGPATLAFGAEHRRESVRGRSDEAGQRREWLFGNFLPTRGSNRVNEAFAEVLMPLAETLEFNGAVRVADYSYSGIEVPWKAGLTWRPLQSLLLRGVRSRDIRAPNLSNLYQAGLTQRQNVLDRWNGDVRQNILRISQGNLDLNPEIADTTSLGVVFTPAGLPGLQGAIDYYSIDIKDAISTLSNQETVDGCYEGDQSLCRYVTRDASGTITELLIQPINIANQKVRGVDVDLSYRHGLPTLGDDADLDFRVVASRLLEDTRETPFASHDYAGENRDGSPKWRALATATFRSGPARLGASARFIGSGVLRNDWVDGVDIDDNTVPSTWYLGLFGSYAFGDRMEAYFRIDNALDRDPVVIATDNNGLNATLYDVVGRYFTAGLRFEF
ncbi:TonB-dependent receptor plug domain-containing protein [Luteimonas sp. R10]|uniref:TonB-dependent receptor plug domain-containing protein n=1 Tax=Luteimonas sp. R10 TaxID=3108176 RepID=UPI00308D7EF3|nr:TonB-dependent receptor [Luteimonas sp. R10]